MPPNTLFPVDTLRNDLPSLQNFDAKEVRAWFRDNTSVTELPEDFNLLVSHATNLENKPFINHAGTWPTIVLNWASWGWANNREATTQLIETALYNTNATQDLNSWMFVYEQLDQQGKEALQTCFMKLLPSALSDGTARNTNFHKNMSCIVVGYKTWLTEACIANLDVHIFSLFQKNYSPNIDVILPHVCRLWLRDPATVNKKITVLGLAYQLSSDFAKEQMAFTLKYVFDFITEKNAIRLLKKITGKNSFTLLSNIISRSSSLVKKYETRFIASSLTQAVKDIPDYKLDKKLLETCFSALFNNPAAFKFLDTFTKKRIALLFSVSPEMHTSKNIDWYNGVAKESELPENLFALLDTFQIQEWKTAAQYFEVNTKKIPLQDINFSSLMI